LGGADTITPSTRGLFVIKPNLTPLYTYTYIIIQQQQKQITKKQNAKMDKKRKKEYKKKHQVQFV
jgi:hypothetical protein